MAFRVMLTTLHLSIAEYDQMVRRGAFDDLGRKIELIRGELAEMKPAGPLHNDLVIYLVNWSAANCDHEKTLVTSQTDLELREQASRPEPDVMWLRKARYRVAHPQAADVQLAIEVSDSSLIRDLEIKRRLYAEAEIIEYWIVDAPANCVHIHRQPSGGDYQSRQVFKNPDFISPLFAPSAQLNLADLFLSP